MNKILINKVPSRKLVTRHFGHKTSTWYTAVHKSSGDVRLEWALPVCVNLITRHKNHHLDVRGKKINSLHKAEPPCHPPARLSKVVDEFPDALAQHQTHELLIYCFDKISHCPCELHHILPIFRCSAWNMLSSFSAVWTLKRLSTNILKRIINVSL